MTDEPRKDDPWSEKRYEPLPPLLRLPGRWWRQLGLRGRALAAAVGVAAVVATILLAPRIADVVSENERASREADTAVREAIRQRLVEDQRPRRASLSEAELRSPRTVASALAVAVADDAGARIDAGELDGPLSETACEPIRRTLAEKGVGAFTCLAEVGARGSFGESEILSGYRFRARVDLRSGAAAWCKENPRPLHPDQEEFIVVPLSRACLVR